MTFDQSTITSIALAVTAIATAYTAYLAQKAKPVLESIKVTGEANHTLSNSAMGATITTGIELAEKSAKFAQRLADLTKAEGDMEAAKEAWLLVDQQKMILQTHLIQQAKVDAMNPAPPKPPASPIN